MKYSASKLYEAYRQFCQALGRKPQSTNAFKNALEKLPNVYQHRASCLAPYIRPLIFGFSNKVSGTGGRMFNA
jgi:hypothetical protein